MMIFLVWGLVAAMADCNTAMDRGDYVSAAQYCSAGVESHPESYDEEVKEEVELEGVPATGVDPYLTSLHQRRQNPESEVPDQYKWAASLSYGFSDFSPNRGHWHDYSITLRHYWKHASLGFEYLSAGRFELNDDAFALDAYVDFWRRAYANLRYQYSQDAILYPDDSYRIEIFQGVGKGWELSGSYDHMDFGNNNVDMYGAGLGKYTGNWYLRWRTLFIPSTARLGISHRAIARYYYAGNGDDYIEINGGFSRGGEFIRGTRIVETTKSQSFGGALQKYFNPRWGIKLSAGYDDDKDSFVERSILVGILLRWR